MTIRVLVVDDQELLRTAFAALIEAEDDMEVVGQAAEGAEALRLATILSPDVIVMDVRMPVMDGIEATRRITAASTAGSPRVLILTTFDLDEYVFAAMRAGASGFVLKSRPPEELLEAIRVIAAGEALLAPNVTRRLIAHFATADAVTDRAAGGPRTAHRARTRGAAARGAWAVQSGDRRDLIREPEHGEDAREPHPHQTRRSRPRPAGGDRLRGGARSGRLTSPAHITARPVGC